MTKKWINLLLSSAVFFIWAAIIYNYFWETTGTTETSYLQKKIEKRDIFLYKKSYSDKTLYNPFITPYTKRKKNAKHKPKVSKDKNIIKTVLRLQGIISDQKGKLALIQGPDNDVYFLRENDLFKFGKVIQIRETELTILYKKKLFTMTLQ